MDLWISLKNRRKKTLLQGLKLIYKSLPLHIRRFVAVRFFSHRECDESFLALLVLSNFPSSRDTHYWYAKNFPRRNAAGWLAGKKEVELSLKASQIRLHHTVKIITQDQTLLGWGKKERIRSGSPHRTFPPQREGEMGPTFAHSRGSAPAESAVKASSALGKWH